MTNLLNRIHAANRHCSEQLLLEFALDVRRELRQDGRYSSGRTRLFFEALLKYLKIEAFTCDDCGEIHLIRERNSVSIGYVCDSCYENYFRCDSCGEEFHRNHYGDNGMCENCYTDEPESCDSLRGYSTNILDVFDGFKTLPNENDSLFLGIELEVNTRSKWERCEAVESFTQCLDRYAICKEDGSLDDSEGFEIVTIPATLAYHKKALESFFRKNDKHEYVSSWNRKECGMHVHIGLETISPLVLGRMLVFVNDEKNEEFLSLVAGRPVNRNAPWAATKHKTLRSGVNPEKEHYEALSVSRSTSGKTCELRIFKGNVAKAGVLKNIEFAHALVMFAKQSGNRKISISDFVSFVKEPRNRKEYANLYSFFLRNEYIKEAKQKAVSFVKEAA